VIVAALVAVNAVGDIVDPATGKVVAGVRTEDGKGLADARTLLRTRPVMRASSGEGLIVENTTLGIVATNATLTKTQATRVAQIAHDGFARAIVPVHTASDGDTIFALATGSLSGNANADLIGWAAAEAIAQAIVRAARAATSIPSYPAARDLQK
jgi:L-aminopeptidase/D-esterase-like protein